MQQAGERVSGVCGRVSGCHVDTPVGKDAKVSDMPELPFDAITKSEAFLEVHRRAARPGVTTLVGPAGSGKTALVQALARDFGRRGLGRSVVISGHEVLHLAVASQRAADLLGGVARRGDLVVIDGLDEVPQQPTPQDLHVLADQPSFKEAHILLTIRPVAAAVLEARATLTIGGQPPVTISELPGTVVELTWTPTAVRRLLEKVIDPTFNGTVERLLSDSAFLEAPDGGASRVNGLQRLMMMNILLQDAPSLMLMSDAQERIRVLPTTMLPTAAVDLGLARQTRVAPWLLYRRSRELWLPGAAALEELINDPNVSEQALQDFFERHPRLLARNDHDRVLPHPVLARDEGGDLIPDFMLEPQNDFADILDLKLPAQPVVVGKANRLRQSAAVSEAMAQVREYRAYFDDPRHREHFERRYGARAYRPSVVVVIGRDPTVDPFELRRLWDDLPRHAEVLTYDGLLRRIRRLGAL